MMGKVRGAQFEIDAAMIDRNRQALFMGCPD
jgi:hypothetical protein